MRCSETKREEQSVTHSTFFLVDLLPRSKETFLSFQTKALLGIFTVLVLNLRPFRNARQTLCTEPTHLGTNLYGMQKASSLR